MQNSRAAKGLHMITSEMNKIVNGLRLVNDGEWEWQLVLTKSYERLRGRLFSLLIKSCFFIGF